MTTAAVNDGSCGASIIQTRPAALMSAPSMMTGLRGLLARWRRSEISPAAGGTTIEMNATRLVSVANLATWSMPPNFKTICGTAIVSSAALWKLSGIQYAFRSACSTILRMPCELQPDVDVGDEEQRQQQRAEQAADDDDAERPSRRDRRIEPERERKHAEDHGRCRHDDRTEADARALFDRRERVHACGVGAIREIDEQDAVLRHEADEQDRADERE